MSEPITNIFSMNDAYLGLLVYDYKKQNTISRATFIKQLQAFVNSLNHRHEVEFLEKIPNFLILDKTNNYYLSPKGVSGLNYYRTQGRRFYLNNLLKYMK